MRQEDGTYFLEVIRHRLGKEAVVVLVVSDAEGCSISSNLPGTEEILRVLAAVLEEGAKSFPLEES